MDKTLRGRRGNTRGGTTKKREISRTLLSINLHFLVGICVERSIWSRKQRRNKQRGRKAAREGLVSVVARGPRPPTGSHSQSNGD